MVFSKDTLLLPNTSIERISLSPSNHCWAIANSNTELLEITDVDQLIDHSVNLNQLTSSTLSDVVVTKDSSIVYVGTHHDYLIQYRNGLFRKFSTDEGLMSPHINSLIWAPKTISTILYPTYPYSSGLAIGTDEGVYSTHNNSLVRTFFRDNYPPSVVHGSNKGSIYFVLNYSMANRCNSNKINKYWPMAIGNNITAQRSFSTFDHDETDSILTFVDLVLPSHQDPLGLGRFYWGTKNGLRRRDQSCNYNTTRDLDSVSVNKLFELRFFPMENYGDRLAEIPFMLIGTDSGLYYCRSNWERPFASSPIQYVPITKGYKIMDIDVDSCNSRVWLATDKGLLRLKLNAGHPFIAPESSLRPQGNTMICVNQPIKLDAIRGSSYNYTWQHNNVDVVGAVSSSYTTNNLGEYRVIYNYSDQCGRQYTDTSIKITLVLDTIVCDSPFSQDTIKLCQGATTTLSTTCPANRYSFTWYKDNTPLNNLTSSLHINSQGFYKVKITNCNNYSTISDSVFVSYTILPVPEPVLVPDKPLCQGQDTLTISVNAGDYDILWWRNYNLISSNNNLDVYKTTQQGLLQVSFKKGACTKISNDIHVLFNTISVVKISSNSPNPVCEGKEVILTANNASNNYQWSDQSTNKNLIVNESGWYKVNSIDYNSCASSDSLKVDFVPLPIIELGSDTLFCEQLEIPITLKIPNIYESYIWNGLMTGSNTFDAYRAGQYVLTVVDENNCSASDEIIIKSTCPDLFIPNLFIPNNDGLNDRFHVEGLLPHSTMKIYNRYGNLIYSNSSYDNQWDANEVSAGVYYYELNNKYYTEPKKGWVQVLK